MSASIKLEWNDKLLTGDEIVDTQHKYLVELINEVADAIETKQHD